MIGAVSMPRRRVPPVALGIGAIAVGALAALSMTVAPPAAVIMIALAFGIAIAAFREPFAGLVAFTLIATILPFAVLPARVVFAPSLVDVALTTTLVAWIFRALHRREPLVPTAVSPLVLLFIGMAAACFILGTGHAAVSGDTTRLFLKLVNSILVFFSVLHLVRTEEKLARIVRTLVLGATAAAAAAVVLYALPAERTSAALASLGVFGYPTGGDILRPIAGTTTLRATGTAIDPNVLGGTLMLAAAIIAAQALAPSPILPRPLLLAGGAVLIAALGLSYSRSAWLGTAAAIVYLATVRERRLWIVLAIGALAMVVFPPGQAALERLASGFAARDPAAAMRLDEYRNAIEIITRYPLFGIGFGPAPTIDLVIGVSSLYLTIGEQMGLLGLTLFLAIVAAALFQTLRTRPERASGLWGLTAGVQAAMVAALVAGLFDHYFFNLRFPHMVALFWLLLGLLVVAARLAKTAAAGVDASELDRS